MQKWTDSATVLLRSARLPVLVLDSCRKQVKVCALKTRLQGRRSSLQMLSIRRRGSFGCLAKKNALSAELKAEICFGFAKIPCLPHTTKNGVLQHALEQATGVTRTCKYGLGLQVLEKMGNRQMTVVTLWEGALSGQGFLKYLKAP